MRLATLRLELSHASKGLMRRPVIPAMIVVALTLGVGVNGALFSVLDRVFIRTPPGVRDAEQLRRIRIETKSRTADRLLISAVGVPDIDAFQEALESYGDVAGYLLQPAVHRRENGTTISTAVVTEKYFQVLGVTPAVGRFFDRTEAAPDAPAQTAVISASVWRSEFGSDPAILGKSIRIDSVHFTIIGVANERFDGIDLNAIEVWLPLGAVASFQRAFMKGLEGSGFDEWRTTPHREVLAPIVRLDRGTSPVLVQRLLEQAYRGTTPPSAFLHPTARVETAKLSDLRTPEDLEASGHRRFEIGLVMALVGFVALIVCVANVACLLMLRGFSRRREFGLRLALGMSKPRLYAQLGLELAIVASIASALSIFVVYWGATAIKNALLPDVFLGAGLVGHRTILFTFSCGFLGAFVAGITPAVMSKEYRVFDVLKGDAGHIERRLGTSFTVVGQLALCTVLLICSGLFVRSLRQALSIDLGFNTSSLVQVETVGLDAVTAARLLPQLKGAVGRIPGVRRATITYGNLVRGAPESFEARYENGDTTTYQLRVATRFIAVDNEFFSATGVTIAHGRAIGESDTEFSEPVMVVSQAMALAYWSRANVVGECLRLVGAESPCVRIVGVAGDTRQTVRGPFPLRFYIPLAQPPERYFMPNGSFMYLGRSVIVATNRDLSSAVYGAIQRTANETVRAAGFGVRVQAPRVQLESELRPMRVSASLATGLGVLTLALAVFGLFGAIAFDVSRRSREFGVRLACGARAADVLKGVVMSAMRTTLLGGMAGIAIAASVVPVLTNQLFETSPTDPQVIGGVLIVLLLVSLIASVGPALRASRVNPVVALRADE